MLPLLVNLAPPGAPVRFPISATARSRALPVPRLTRWAVLCASLALLGAAPPPVSAQSTPPARSTEVILAVFDGLGHQRITQDPVADELVTLRKLIRRGALAEGVQPAFPSTTANSFAAMWTGAYGDVNGVAFNDNPILPRFAHSLLDRRSGFLSDSLQVEPLWEATARQGVATVALNVPQSYPFRPFSPPSPGKLVIANGYQTRLLAPPALLTAADVQPCSHCRWDGLLPRGARLIRDFQWSIAGVLLRGAIVQEKQSAPVMYIRRADSSALVRVVPHPTEMSPPRRRPLARYFSDPLLLDVPQPQGPLLPAAMHFRLYELSAAGDRFQLFHTHLREVAVSGSFPPEALRELLGAAGGFLENSPYRLWRAQGFGKPLYAGGDGTAERRYLECVELVVRQFNRYSQWFWQRYRPRFLIDYTPYPDEFDHAFLSLALAPPDRPYAAHRATYQQFRRWAYAALEHRFALLRQLAGNRRTLVVAGDHGLAPVHKGVNVNAALAQAGLYVPGADNRPDLTATLALHNRYAIQLNSRDRRAGIVAPEDAAAVLQRVEQALSSVRDPDTQAPVFLRFFRPGEHSPALGIGGPAGGDLYFDLAEGYVALDGAREPIVFPLPAPEGTHGFYPLRPEMLAALVAAGPQIPPHRRLPRARIIDIAPLVAQLLGVQPPAAATGVSPLAAGARGKH